MDFLKFDDFLSETINRELYDTVVTCEADFIAAGVVDNSNEYPNWRKAKVSYWNQKIGPFSQELERQIRNAYNEVCKTLSIDILNHFSVDIQLTMHNNGDYFKKHSDRYDNNETKNRVLTFVYYFNKIPKPYTGGELTLHLIEDMKIVPENNMIVFFNPAVLHEVKMVSCPVPSFENSRFTLNGWIIDDRL